jgi:hypothetical protein
MTPELLEDLTETRAEYEIEVEEIPDEVRVVHPFDVFELGSLVS